jgi:hypothetical protein
MWLLLKLLKHPPENSVLRESRNVERPYRTSEPYETGASPKGALTERRSSSRLLNLGVVEKGILV